jgi:hypothetical protein
VSYKFLRARWEWSGASGGQRPRDARLVESRITGPDATAPVHKTT